MRKECRPRELKKRELRRAFGSKRDDIAGELRKLCNEELNDLY
jgi:hypothetical protein